MGAVVWSANVALMEIDQRPDTRKIGNILSGKGESDESNGVASNRERCDVRDTKQAHNPKITDD